MLCHHPPRVVVALFPVPLLAVRTFRPCACACVRFLVRPGGKQVLEEYVKLFDMREKTFVEALRAFLKEFRLPGEVG